MHFLPNDYEAPKTPSGYMKLNQGENKIRILTQPILGWEEWTRDKKPVRYHYDKKPEKPIDAKNPPKHFWAFVVWNYKEEVIQILHITQANVRKGIEALCKDPEWGDPFAYDIKIYKEGEELKTKYAVNPCPMKPVAQSIIDAFNDRPCKLEALFTGDDPFADWTNPTPGVFSQHGRESIDLDVFAISFGDDAELFKAYAKEVASKMNWGIPETVKRLKKDASETASSFGKWKNKAA